MLGSPRGELAALALTERGNFQKVIETTPLTATRSVSLRLGHARVLTSHCDVIHCAHAASLPRGEPYNKRRLYDERKINKNPVGANCVRPL